MSWGSLLGIAPLLVVALGGALLMVAEAFTKRREESDERSAGPSSELALATAITLFAGAVFSAAVWFVGPDKIWVTASYADALGAMLGKLWPTSKAVVTELGHSRTIIRVSGPNARELIARFLAIDLDPAVFPAGRVTAAGLHGLGVTLHHVSDGTYDLYLPRTFALSLFEGIVEIAEQWGVEVKG